MTDDLDDDFSRDSEDNTPIEDVYRESPIARVEGRLTIHSRRLGKLREFQLRTEGVDTNNGRFGKLREAVESHRKILVGVGMVALTSLGGAIGAIWHAASEDGARNAQVERNTRDIAECRSDLDTFKTFTTNVLLHLPPGDLK